jgi:hypothetical protein
VEKTGQTMHRILLHLMHTYGREIFMAAKTTLRVSLSRVMISFARILLNAPI